jgi:hypothetical protein
VITLKSSPNLRDVILTRDGVLNYSIKSPTADDWPLGTESRMEFTGRDQSSLGTLEADVSGRLITFKYQPDDINGLNNVPDGANAEVFITLPEDDGDFDYKYQVGRVVRLQVAFPDSPLNVDTFVPRTFSGEFPATQSLDDYILRNGKIGIIVNGGSLPNGLGPNFPLLFQNAACLYKVPVVGDSIRFNFSIVTGTGKTRFVVCSNYEMTNYLALEMESGISNNRIWIGTGSDPLTLTYRTPSQNHTYANGDNYTLYYNFLTNTIAIYQGTDLTPLLEWTDDTNLVQHGEGHRYFGFSWLGSLLSDGIQPTAWVIKDDP